MQNKIEEKLKEIIKHNLKKKYKCEIESNIPLTDLGVNSLVFIKIIVEVEKEFKIEVDDEFLANNDNVTFGKFVNYLESAVK